MVVCGVVLGVCCAVLFLVVCFGLTLKPAEVSGGMLDPTYIYTHV